MINFKRSINFWHDLQHNIVAGAWLFIGSRKSLEYLRPSILQLLFWAILAASINILFSWIVRGGQNGIGYFNTQGLISYALWPFLALLTGIFLAQKYNNSRILLAPALFWLIIDSFVITGQTLLQYLAQIDILPLFFDPYLEPIFTLLFIWQSLSIIWVFSRTLGWQWWERILISLATIATLIVWQVSTRGEPIWKVDEQAPSISEEVFYTQPALLQQALNKIQFSNFEDSHWYFMGVAGMAFQDVFMSEVSRIKEQFDTRFNTAGRSIILANNAQTAMSLPFASKTSIEQTLKHLGQQMNRDNDILFLYLTSHGQENLFQLENEPLALDDIDPLWLKQTLDKSGIRWRVIVISACRSGSFIPVLRSEDTLIITSSADDKDSFGCTHEADYTYFGRAFFEQALREKSNLKQAFISAQGTVAKWEQAQGFKASEPQWSIGKNMELMLPQFEQKLFPSSTYPTQP